MYYDVLAVQDKEFLKKLGFSPLELNISVLMPKTVDELKVLAKKKSDFIVLKNPNEKILKAAIDKCLIDAVDSFVKYPFIKKMAERNVAVVINFNSLLNARNIQKTIHLLSKTVKLAKKYKTPIIVTSGAENKWDLRSVSELIALCEVLGITAGEAKKTLHLHQEKILERKRLKKEGKWVSPEVKVV